MPGFRFVLGGTLEKKHWGEARERVSSLESANQLCTLQKGKKNNKKDNEHETYLASKGAKSSRTWKTRDRRRKRNAEDLIETMLGQ